MQEFRNIKWKKKDKISSLAVRETYTYAGIQKHQTKLNDIRFSNSIDSDKSQRFFKCATHVKSLRCDLNLDGNSRNVTVSGVGRIVWRKDYFPKITRFIFKQYVQTSESQLENSTCDILTAEKIR